MLQGQDAGQPLLLPGFVHDFAGTGGTQPTVDRGSPVTGEDTLIKPTASSPPTER